MKISTDFYRAVQTRIWGDRDVCSGCNLSDACISDIARIIDKLIEVRLAQVHQDRVTDSQHIDSFYLVADFR